MYYKLWSMSALAALALTACEDDRPFTNSADRVPLQLTATRIGDTRLNGEAWQEGDQIGVYLVDQYGNFVDGTANARFIVNPSTNVCTVANADSTIFLDKDLSYTVLAYYPYNSELSESVGGYTVGNWNRPGNQSSLDVLYATVSGITVNAPNATINFARQCSRLEVNFTAADGVELENLNVKLSGRNFSQIFGITTGKWDLLTSTEGDSIQFVVNVDGTTAKASAILPPSGTWEYNRPVLTMTVSSNDVRTYTFPEGFTFETGKSYTFNFSFTPAVDIDAIVDEITSMEESGSVSVTGFLSDNAVKTINNALETLHDLHSDVKVTLDLTGLSNSILPNFYEMRYLDGVILPEGITSLDGNFSRCYGLHSVNIPASVTSIGDYTFFHCNSLDNVTVAEGNTAYKMEGKALYTIDGTKLVSYCNRSSEESFTVPASVTEIGDCAFDAASITEVNFESDENLTTIGEYGFAYCENLTSFQMPNSVTSVGTCLFENSNLTSVTISSSLATLSDGMFSNCKFKDFVVPETVTELNGSVFWSCQSLVTLVLPSSLATISGSYLYLHCNALTTVAYCGTEKQRAAITDYSGITTDESLTWIYNFDPETMGVADGYVYVDLGLPNGTKWAWYNVGATKPEGYGNYYAWGETTGYNEGKTDWGTYKFGTSTSLTKYNEEDHLTVLEAEDDAATVNWGSKWRTPSSEELQELIDNCPYSVETKNDVVGYEFSAKNGNSIFLPLAGRCMTTDPYGVNEGGNYWSSTLAPDGPPYCIGAICLLMDPIWDNFGLDAGCVRAYGMPIRAVLAE